MLKQKPSRTSMLRQRDGRRGRGAGAGDSATMNFAWGAPTRYKPIFLEQKQGHTSYRSLASKTLKRNDRV